MPDNNEKTSALEQMDFESMNLQLGAKLQFLTHRGRTPTQHISTFIGIESNEYVLLRLPRAQGVGLSFYEGEKISVRVFSGTMICTFDTSVIQPFYHPLNCLCLVFPKKIQVKKLRREMRIKVEIGGHIAFNASQAQKQAVNLVNLSATGCQISTDGEVGDIDDLINLSFYLPLFSEDDLSSITVNAKIRNIIDDSHGDSEGYLIGMEFIEFDPTEQLIVRNYVYESLVDRRQSIA
ncbi:flagellar brake protein [Methylobacillus gramineus]|uniref:flagellar brake protein n=1 Tax=Methylobacillus gramineus TaxID=755169 RepID=UPI001D000222|nr:flagellar brake protein [Methylobacillus gramineus]MCB5184819.1 flagellar brake protein [Methylobacillus gramineus]